MKMKPEVAVVILNWNGEKLLEEFLPSVVEYTSPEVGRVVVADNGSTDSSLSLLHSQFPSTYIIEFKENYGFSGGYNRALKMIGEKYTVLLNSDVAVKSDWLTPLYRFMEAHPEVGACQPKIRAFRAPDKFEYAGAAGGYIDRHGYPYCRGRVFGSVETDNGQYDDARTDLFWATGAALMVRTELYNRLGGLDELFFAHMEEIDLCWRVQLAGYKIGYVPDSVVWHVGGASLDASNPRKTYLNFRNNLLMLYKNLPDGVRGRKLFVRRLLDTIAWLKFVATFDMKNAAAVWRAHRDFRKMRCNYTSHPSVDLLGAVKRPDILFDHYIARRRPKI